MQEQPRILIIDRDPIAGPALQQTLAGLGHAALLSRSADEAIETLERERAAARDTPIGVVVIDQDTSGPGGGLDLVRRLHDDWPGVVPVMLSAFRKVESAVKAMRLGAADYLLKPVVEAELAEAIERAAQRHLLLAGSEPDAPNDPSVDPQTDSAEIETAPTTSLRLVDDGWTPMPLSEAMKEPEKRILLAALEANDWNRQETARQLDINRTTLYKKIRQHRLDEPA